MEDGKNCKIYMYPKIRLKLQFQTVTPINLIPVVKNLNFLISINTLYRYIFYFIRIYRKLQIS